MKKETRFSAKCERFIKLIVQLFPLFVIFGLLIINIAVSSSDNFMYWVDSNGIVTSDFNDLFGGISNAFIYGFSNAIESGLSWFYFDLYDFIFNVIDLTFSLGSNDLYFIFEFIINYSLYLVLVEVLWLIKNVLMFLPKIGNYLITKWSGD